ncbi:hypothetical protein DL769_005689 [Monosporascus sp. CRB-8-3]|nr:hypothetical protein DL769_005689 [Monosporascus sp. CRB-8-3]
MKNLNAVLMVLATGASYVAAVPVPTQENYSPAVEARTPQEHEPKDGELPGSWQAVKPRTARPMPDSALVLARSSLPWMRSLLWARNLPWTRKTLPRAKSLPWTKSLPLAKNNLP